MNKLQLSLSEVLQIQIALSSRIDFLLSILGAPGHVPGCVMSARLEEQTAICIDVLARIRGEA